ncbi:MAG: 30S ribosomal protein S6 [Alphaproteobacteria bacterium]|nr:30S ribosomal protein S6 [Alphaproteobacteria bacterium]
MPYYENVFITRQEVSAAQVDALADTFAEVISGGGGTIHRREYWGLKTLSYRIKKNRKGHYVLFNIEAPSDAVREMERQMRLNEDVLRHLTVRLEAAPEGPSVVMQGRGDRERARRDDERPRRDDERPPRSDRSAKDRKVPEGDEK